MFGFRSRYVLLRRRDGLGERLCAMMNAIRVADALGHKFKFMWEDDVWNPVYHKLSTAESHQVLGQSIAPVRQVFSEDFIKKCYVSEMPGEGTLLPFPPANLKLRKVRKKVRASGVLGWEPNQHRFNAATEELLISRRALSYPEAFGKIGFASELQKVIDQAFRIDLAPFVALHLRSGDMVFGEVRRWGHWENKVLNPFVAGDIIQEAQRENKTVVLFGQDVETLHHLKRRFGCELAIELASFDSAVEQSIFEIMLMSRATSIVSGNSGFSRAASMIGGSQVNSMFELRDRPAYAAITLKQLQNADADVHPLMKAYSYWQAFVFDGRNLLEDRILHALEKAQEHDPDNLLYPLVRASRLYRANRDGEGEAVLSDACGCLDAGALSPDHPLVVQLNFKYYSTPPTHIRQFEDFLAAAQRQGNQFARALTDNLDKDLLQ